jgi:phosphate acetyltransferase
MTDVLQTLRTRATRESPRILLPEHRDERVLTAAAAAARDGVAHPVVFETPGSLDTLCGEHGIDPDLFTTLTRPSGSAHDAYVEEYASLRDVSESTAKIMLESNLVRGMILLRLGDVEGVVAGALHPTAEVVAVANSVVGLDPATDTASSFFLMVTENPAVGQNGALLYADCGVNIAPSSDQLADIAETTATTARRLLDWEPKIAMLSFSTKGSADHEAVKKVRAATETVRDRTNLLVEGELQTDAALVPSVAKRKVGDDAVVQGDANVLVFPDLDAGNIAYKLTERVAGAKALGPVLQGYSRPVSDLSRGSSDEDIYDVIMLTAARAANWGANSIGNTVSGGLLERREQQQGPLHPPPTN